MDERGAARQAVLSAQHLVKGMAEKENATVRSPSEITGDYASGLGRIERSSKQRNNAHHLDYHGVNWGDAFH